MQEPRRAGLEHADRVLAHRVVESGGTEGSLGSVTSHDDVATDVMRPGDDGRDGDRLLGCDTVGDAVELRPRLRIDALDEDLKDAAAGQPHRECIVIADPVRL